MLKQCTQCAATFEITSEDIAFYEKVSPEFNGKKELIPPPTLCPECRCQRRLAFRNERHLYHRKCDISNKQIISLYSPDKPNTVYETTAWWSDHWDAQKYKRQWGNKSVFALLLELHREVPHLSKMNVNCENCEYSNQSYGSKNCYMSVAADFSQDSFFVDYCATCNNCVDCFSAIDCEICYECIDCVSCYNSQYLHNCLACRDSLFCTDCRDCNRCFGCAGLRNQSLCIYNKKVSEQEWKAKISELAMTPKVIQMSARLSCEQKLKVPHLTVKCTQCENCIGDNLRNCSNVRYCFDMIDILEARYCWQMPKKSRDVYDSIGGGGELLYECSSVGLGYHNAFCHQCWNAVHSLLYCFLCMSCKNCFCCAGLKNCQYCVFNQQYTKEEYEELVPKIIEKMRADGEWGEFFPVSMSPFGYNETAAQEYFPLTKEEVLKKGWKWHEEEEVKDQYMGPAYIIPDNIKDVEDDITKQILRCEVSGKPYKIIPQELKFYREMGIPIPRRCPDQRHKDRMALRNPRKLWNRKCAKCMKPIATSYSPDRPEIVYCEACYLETVH